MKLKEESSCEHYINPNLSRELWGIKFRSPIMNAAGMFKNGECYEMVAKQGAGAYLGGTGTWNPRNGNERSDISLPFAPYPRSHAASNWLGFPNEGDLINAKRASKLERIVGCPVGWSVMGSPDYQGEEKLRNLVKGMWLYKEAGVDFLEINESCPNTSHKQDVGLESRLKFVKENFLDQRKRVLPVIVKFSNKFSVLLSSKISAILTPTVIDEPPVKKSRTRFPAFSWFSTERATKSAASSIFVVVLIFKLIKILYH